MTLSAFAGIQLPLPPPITTGAVGAALWRGNHRVAPHPSLITWQPFGSASGLSTPSPALGTWDQGNPSFQQQSVNDQSLTARVPKAVQNRIEKFVEAVNEALELSNAMVASEESDPLDPQTFIYAIQSLIPLIAALKLPSPLILPLQGGGVGAEWHSEGINIELRFRKPYDIYAVFEDARGVIEPFHGRDPDLVRARTALGELSTRSVD